MSDPSRLVHEAPLIHLLEQDTKLMSEEELKTHLSELRALRASPQTRRATTEKAPKKKTGGLDLSQLL